MKTYHKADPNAALGTVAVPTLTLTNSIPTL